ncbi:interleukin-17C [Centropristis striata]|uniref:interleukin-17C n=1 Tax=Centropristis striata TaxID=184440 RepID=UPI0027DF1DD9|nr:interleukin-17C [Centropristis striata]
MDVTQIIIFGLFFLVPVLMQPCYDEDKLSDAAERKLRNHYPQPAEPAAAPDSPVSPASCPVEMFRQPPSKEYKDRSLSPWRYIRVTKADHFPSTYVEAQCLCTGCILIQDNNHPVESHNYNSVRIMQSRVFLKKELCNNNTEGKKYHLKPVTVEVAVGCTCVRTQTITSS